jgi:CRP-like cAMP-binding protein
MPNLFSQLDAHALTAEVQAGVTLFRCGDPVIGAYTIRSGKVALIWTSIDGTTPMDTLGPGAILGLPAALNGEYSLSARVVEDCHLGFLPASRVLDLLSLDREMLQQVTKLLATEVARMRDLARNRRTRELTLPDGLD